LVTRIKRTCYANAIENKIMKMQLSKKKKEHNIAYTQKAHANAITRR